MADYIQTAIQDLHKKSSALHNGHSLQYDFTSSSPIILNCQAKQVIVKDGKVLGILTAQNLFIESKCIAISFPSYIAIKQLFAENKDEIFDKEFVKRVRDLDKTTSVIEVHFGVAENVDRQNRQVVFPLGSEFAAKGIFFISNITRAVSPEGGTFTFGWNTCICTGYDKSCKK
ncbi:MAG: hypothetical protein WBQ25_05500 [Nitrososphaeraceae archaeon]